MRGSGRPFLTTSAPVAEVRSSTKVKAAAPGQQPARQGRTRADASGTVVGSNLRLLPVVIENPGTAPLLSHRAVVAASVWGRCLGAVGYSRNFPEIKAVLPLFRYGGNGYRAKGKDGRSCSPY